MLQTPFRLFLVLLQLGRFRAEPAVQFVDPGFVLREFVGKTFHLGIHDLLDCSLAVVLEIDSPAHCRGERNGDQHTGHLRGEFLHSPHDREGGCTDQQRRDVGLADLLQHAPDVQNEVFAAPHRNTEKLVELRQADDDRGGIGESDNDGVRKEIDYYAEFEYAQRELDDANHQRQQDRQRDELA